MSERVAYDPRTKKRIKEALISFLYEPVWADFNKRLTDLVVKNSMLYGNGQEAFRYKGDVYSLKNTRLIQKPVNLLDRSLEAEMVKYLADLKEINDTEIPYVMNYINQVLNVSDHFPDYFKLFPESLHAPLQKLADECPCRHEHLDEATIQTIQRKNVIPVELMKQRMMYNLLL